MSYEGKHTVKHVKTIKPKGQKPIKINVDDMMNEIVEGMEKNSTDSLFYLRFHTTDITYLTTGETETFEKSFMMLADKHKGFREMFKDIGTMLKLKDGDL